MSSYKNLEDIKKEFEKRIDNHAALLEAWEKVERVTKKDGSDFKALSKNFNNATVIVNEFVLRPSKKIRVYGRTKRNDFVEDFVETTDLVKYSKRPVDAARILKESYLEPWYEKTVDEIFEDIETQKEYHRKAIEGYEKQIQEANFYYDIISAKMEEIHKVLNNMCEKGKSSNEFLSLRYALENIVKNYYFR